MAPITLSNGVSILVILEIQSDLDSSLKLLCNILFVSILVILEIQSDLRAFLSISSCFLRFNPCYLGNTIRSEGKDGDIDKLLEFQSLLSWKYNQICKLIMELTGLMVFQSLLSWKYNQIKTRSETKTRSEGVSILVILEIQSDHHLMP